MNKVFQINLGGMVFTIEEEAYLKLKTYLDRLHAHFGSNAQDIVSDIESRMAELFQQRLLPGKSVLFMEDVNEVLSIMGDVDQMERGEGATEMPPPPQPQRPLARKLRRNPYDESLGGVCSGIASYFDIDPVIVRVLFVVSVLVYGTGFLFYFILWLAIPKANTEEAEFMLYQKQNRTRKLFRDPERQAVGGVCSGIANFFGIDVLWVRLGFLISFFFFGTGFLLYIVLWAVIPKALTVAEKLQMRGETVDIHSIGREVQSNPSARAKTAYPKGGGFGRQLFEIIFKLIAGIIIFVCVSVAIGILVGIFAVYMGVGDTHWVQTFIRMNIWDPAVRIAIKAGILLIIALPVVGILFLLLRLAFNFRLGNRVVLISLLSMFFIGVGLLTFAGVRYSAGVRAKSYKTEAISELKSDTVRLVVNRMEDAHHEDEGTRISMNSTDIVVNENGLLLPIDGIRVKKGKSDSITLRIRRSARASSETEAESYIQDILFKGSMLNGVITVDEGLWLNKDARYHMEDVEIKLFLPIGTVLVTDEYGYRMLDNRYRICGDSEPQDYIMVMTAKGLKGVNCADDWEAEEEHYRKEHKRGIYKDKKDGKVHIRIGDKEDGIDINIDEDGQKDGQDRIEVKQKGPVKIIKKSKTKDEDRPEDEE